MELCEPGRIAGVRVATSRLVSDARGEFARLFDASALAAVHGNRPVVQVNRSLNREAGTIRGLHFQRAPALEAKWVRCLRGRVFDVALDLRRGSPTFLHHFAIELSAAKGNTLFIPEGCAHGFQVIEPDSELLYLHTAPYVPEHEGGIRFDDPCHSIAWPLPPVGLSQRDRSHPLLPSDFQGLPT